MKDGSEGFLEWYRGEGEGRDRVEEELVGGVWERVDLGWFS